MLIRRAMPDADLLRQPHRQAPGGQQADAGVGVCEPGVLRGDQDVAVQRELQPARHRRAVDRTDHRLGHRRPLRRDVGQFGGVAELLEVQSRAEHRIGAGEDDDVDVIVGLRVAQRRERTACAAPTTAHCGTAAGSASACGPGPGCRSAARRLVRHGINLSWRSCAETSPSYAAWNRRPPQRRSRPPRASTSARSAASPGRTGANVEAFEEAVAEVTATTTRLLAQPAAASATAQDGSAAASARGAGAAQARGVTVTLRRTSPRSRSGARRCTRCSTAGRPCCCARAASTRSGSRSRRRGSCSSRRSRTATPNGCGAEHRDLLDAAAADSTDDELVLRAGAKVVAAIEVNARSSTRSSRCTSGPRVGRADRLDFGRSTASPCWWCRPAPGGPCGCAVAEYAGCKSWVPLPVDPAGQPVHDDGAGRIARRTRRCQRAACRKFSKKCQSRRLLLLPVTRPIRGGATRRAPGMPPPSQDSSLARRSSARRTRAAVHGIATAQAAPAPDFSGPCAITVKRPATSRSSRARRGSDVRSLHASLWVRQVGPAGSRAATHRRRGARCASTTMSSRPLTNGSPVPRLRANRGCEPPAIKTRIRDPARNRCAVGSSSMRTRSDPPNLLCRAGIRR